MSYEEPEMLTKIIKKYNTIDGDAAAPTKLAIALLMLEEVNRYRDSLMKGTIPKLEKWIVLKTMREMEDD